VRDGQVYGGPACIARNAEVARVLFGDDERSEASLRDVGLVRVCLIGSDSRGAPRPRENPLGSAQGSESSGARRSSGRY
jgi:hypothetical protein